MRLNMLSGSVCHCVSLYDNDDYSFAYVEFVSPVQFWYAAILVARILYNVIIFYLNFEIVYDFYTNVNVVVRPTKQISKITAVL